MKKVAIITTGLLLGFFVFLTGFPTVATASHKANIRDCNTNCLTALNLSSSEKNKAEVLLLLGKGDKVIIFEIMDNPVDVQPDDSVPVHSRHRGLKLSDMTYTNASPGCVTINGRTYCW